jgi:phenylacetate-CoA ligase
MSTAWQILGTLEQAERLSTAELKRRQNRLLAGAAAHAHANVAGYRDRLGPVFGRSGKFLPGNWQQVPILTREEFREGGQDFFAHNLPAQLKPLKWSATSGTTGQPLLFAKTRLTTLVSACLNERLMAWHKLDPTKSAAFIHFAKDGESDYPEGKTTRSTSPFGVTATHHWLSVRASVEQMVDWLRRKRPAYLTVYPSIAAEIARAVGQDGASLGIEAVLAYGEALSPEQRDVIEGSVCAPVIDAYSANEIGFIALQCPTTHAYHIPTETILVEVVDENGRAVPAGTVGDIVLTPFYNAAMPLIRYRIGDLGAFATGACPCGMNTPRLETVLGRTRQLFTYSDGSRRFANLNVGALQTCVAVKQYQLIQHTPTRVELIYVPQEGAQPPDMEALGALARRDLAPDVVIEATAVAEIPRSAAGKVERTVSHVAY